MRRSLIGFFVAGLALVMAIAGASAVQAQDTTPTASPTQIGTAAPAATLTPTATPEPVTITIWHGWQGASADALNGIIRDYQATHPAIHITAQYVPGDVRSAVVTAILAQHGPDLFIGDSRWAAGLADKGLITSLDARIMPDLHADASYLGWQTVSYNSLIYALPHDAECIALYYNSQLQATPPTTLDALTTSSPGVTQSPGMIFDFYTTAGWYTGLGEDLFGKGLIGANGQPLSGAAATVQQYLTLIQKAYSAQPAVPGIPGGVPIASDAPFRLGQSASWIDGNWKLTDFRRHLKGALQVAALPSLPNGKAWQSLISTQAIYLSANSAQQDAAFDFGANLLSADAQTKMAQAGQTPVNSSASIQDQAVAAFAKQCAGGIALPPADQSPAFWVQLDDAIYAVTVGGQTPKQAAAAVFAQLVAKPTATP